MAGPFDENLFIEPEPDGVAPKRKRGRPKGSTSRPQTEQPEDQARVSLASVREPGRWVYDPDRTRKEQADQMAGLDFRAFGTKPRIPVVILRDVSSSERGHERAWLEGGRHIGRELAAAPTSRNLVDVVYCPCASTFTFERISHGKDFAVPEEATTR